MQLDSLTLETASPRTHKPKIVNESLLGVQNSKIQFVFLLFFVVVVLFYLFIYLFFFFWGGVRNVNIYRGVKFLWIFFFFFFWGGGGGVMTKSDKFEGSFLCILG